MPHRFIGELKDREKVEDVYHCLRKTLPADRNSRRYLSLVLADRSGQVEALLWEEAERRAERFEALDFVGVTGTAVLFQGRLQLHLTDIRRVDPDGLRAEDFAQRSTRDPAQMWAELTAMLGSLTDPHLRRLTHAYLEDAELVRQLRLAPAARAIHHAYQGGLLEHTLSVMRLTDQIGEHYRTAQPGLLNRDLCLAAAFLHDLGKLWEISSEPGYQYTDAGRLIGHLVLGVEDLGRRVQQLPGFPALLADHLRHIILSHHGRLEFGSPKPPETAEAMVVHRADDLDGQLGSLRAIFNQSASSGWTAYQPAHDRHFLRGWPSGDAPPPSSAPPSGGESSAPPTSSSPTSSSRS